MNAVTPTGQKPMTTDKYSRQMSFYYAGIKMSKKSEYNLEMPRIQTTDNRIVLQGKNARARTSPNFKSVAIPRDRLSNRIYSP